MKPSRSKTHLGRPRAKLREAGPESDPWRPHKPSPIRRERGGREGHSALLRDGKSPLQRSILCAQGPESGQTKHPESNGFTGNGLSRLSD
jgi:hypothetical protein